MATKRNLKVVRQPTPNTPSPGSIRMQAIRDTFDALENLAVNGVREFFGGSDQIRQFADDLDLPPMAVELLVSRGVDTFVKFERIDQLNVWMEREGISRVDLIGEDEEE